MLLHIDPGDYYSAFVASQGALVSFPDFLRGHWTDCVTDKRIKDADYGGIVYTLSTFKRVKPRVVVKEEAGTRGREILPLMCIARSLRGGGQPVYYTGVQPPLPVIDSRSPSAVPVVLQAHPGGRSSDLSAVFVGSIRGGS